MDKHRLPVVASLMAVGAGVVWSFGAICSRKAAGADAFQYMIWRSIGIIVVVEVMAALQGKPWPTIRAWTGGRTMAIANLGLFVASICFVYAVKTTSPANASFLSSLTPLVAVALSKFVGERLSKSTIVALAVGLVGLVITVFSDLEAGNMWGNAMAMMASVGFAVYTVCLRTDTDRDWSPVLPGYGLMMILVCGAITMAHGKTLLPPRGDVLLALLHGAVIIVVGTVMFNVASKQVPAVPMTVFAQTEMVFVPIWGFIMLGLRPKPLTLLGGAIIFGAVVGKALYDAATGRHIEFVAAPDVPLL
ncbi:MAG: DMT family transporter [Actinomycetota bacterium]